MAAAVTVAVAGSVWWLTARSASTQQNANCALLAWGGGPAAVTSETAAQPFMATPVPGLCGGVTAIAAGALHSLAVTSDGMVAAWGSNDAGQLGDGGDADRSDPLLVRGVGGTGLLSNVGCPRGAPASCVPIAAGLADSLALRRDGTVVAWGDNSWGQLGDGTTSERRTPVVVSGLNNVVAIAAGTAHNLALRADGSVVEWGADNAGQLGDGAMRPGANPHITDVRGLGPGSGVTALAAGDAHSLALTGGHVLAWGANDSGQLGDGTVANRTTPARVDQLPSTVVAVSAGSGYNGFSLALEADGAVYAWGEDSFGQLGDGKPPTLYKGRPQPELVTSLGPGSGVTAIAAGGGHALAVKRGRVVIWGFDSVDEPLVGTVQRAVVPNAVGGITGRVTALAAGGSLSMVVHSASGHDVVSPGAPPRAPSPPSLGEELPSSSTPPAPNVLATGPDVTGFGAVMMAADPVHPGRLALAYRDEHKCWVSLSNDGGHSWRELTLAGPDGRIATPASVSGHAVPFTDCDFPSVAFADNGTLYVAFDMIDGGYDAVFLTASSDNGATFAPAQQIDVDAPNPGPASFGDWRPMLAAHDSGNTDAGGIYAVWTRFNSDHVAEQLTVCTKIELADLRRDAVMRCGHPMTLSPSGQVDANNRAAIAVGASGRVAVAWTDTTERHRTGDGSGPEVVDVAVSTNSGRTFGAPEQAFRVTTVCPDFTCPSWAEPIVSIAASPNGELVVAGAGLVDGQARVIVARRGAGSSKWQSVILSPPPDASADTHHTPEVAVAPDGRIDVAYYDDAPDGQQNTWLLSSSDGGATFGSPRRLSDLSSDEAILVPLSADVRIGLVSRDTGYIAAWADTRRGTLDSGKTDVAVSSGNCPC